MVVIMHILKIISDISKGLHLEVTICLSSEWTIRELKFMSVTCYCCYQDHDNLAIQEHNSKCIIIIQLNIQTDRLTFEKLYYIDGNWDIKPTQPKSIDN